ncbi:hypothetical protein HK096_009056 [Nowakowskiella sp. JEL0078]|nr:hypothetical protein HK096_009056 [Nowakowskiella sp. JEL0078]
MSAFDEATKLLSDLKSILASKSPNLVSAGLVLSKLKVLLTKLSFLSVSPSANTRELLLCRMFFNSANDFFSLYLLKGEILETGAQWSTKANDILAFERYISQLKTYYSDYGSILPPSPFVYPLLGLNLLRLLAQNRISEFHTELELIKPEEQTNKFISHPIEIEQCLMEGSYNKVWNARASVPVEEYLFFFDILMDTIRDEIASCSEKAYQSLPITDAITLLYFKTTEEVLKFAEQRGWKVDKLTKKILFEEFDIDAAEIPTSKVIRQTLGYARELERIV